MVADKGDRVGDNHARQARAAIKRPTADADYWIGHTKILNFLGNGDVTTVRTGARAVTVFLIGDGYGYLVAVDAVVDAVHLKVLGMGCSWQHQCQQQ